jgi:hypothetical protein
MMLTTPSIGSRPRFGRVARLAFAAVLLIGGGTALIASSVGAAPAGNGVAHQVATDPQPASGADFSGHGANTHGPYDSTRDGSPSGNGNGNGEAAGKPCAGCVGRADNKNPPGQLPGGGDANAGYECDRNHGVGRSNPAHTGCRAGTPPPSTPPPGTTPPGTTPPGTTPPGTPSSGSGGQPSQVNGAVPGQAVGGVSQSQPGSGLASTGVPVAQLLGWSLVALLAGTCLAVAGRSRLTARATSDPGS